jgi:hypothetical protein
MTIADMTNWGEVMRYKSKAELLQELHEINEHHCAEMAKVYAEMDIAAASRNLSLLYAHTPDDKASASLQGYVDKVRPVLREAVGAGTAEEILETFASAVMGRKHEIEAGGASRAWPSPPPISSRRVSSCAQRKPER